MVGATTSKLGIYYMKLSTRLIVPMGLCTALALAGCSSAGDSKSEEQSGSSAAGATEDGTGGRCDVTVIEGAQSLDTSNPNAEESNLALSEIGLSEDVSAAPTLTFDVPLPVTAESVLVTNEGEGETITSGDLISFNYMVCDTVTGEKMFSTWGATPDENDPVTYILSTANFGETLVNALDGAAVGTRLLWGQPGYSAEQSYDGQASDGFVYVMNITSTVAIPESASGTEIEPSDKTLPTVKFVDGVPEVTIPSDFSDPDELIVETLIQGDGAVVESGETIAVKYSGWLVDGTQFDSAWSADGTSDPVTFPIGIGQVIGGWDQGLVGEKVGSRVLLVIPSDLGYGEAGAGSIPGDSTLIFVVDILAAY